MTDLIDTNVLSELFRASPNKGVMQWAEQVGDVGVSVITIEEIYFGLVWKPSSRLWTAIRDFLQERCHALNVTSEISRMSAEMRGRLQKEGRQRTQSDMLIAASAKVHGLTLVTRNIKDFDGCGLPLLNPFS